MDRITQLYQELLQMYGPQGWWPLTTHNGNNPTKTGAINGYHPKNYSFPRNDAEKFEICLGCFLTQNTGWISVEKALRNLQKNNLLNKEAIKSLPDEKFKELIKPAGYYNQKTKYIKEFIPFFESLDGRIPTRTELLSLRGVGPETADAILLFAFKQPEFIASAYGKRIFSTLGLIQEEDKYVDMKRVCEENLQKDVIMYQEYHALLVEHAKRYYSKKPHGKECPLKKKFGNSSE